MTTETSNAREWVSLLDRAVPFLHDEAAKYDDDGSNEPLELAREIETLLASLPSDESALSPASLAFDGGREAAPCPHTRDTNCDCAAPPPAAACPNCLSDGCHCDSCNPYPPPAAARGDVRGLVAKWRERAEKLERGFGPGDAMLAAGRRACADDLEAALAAEGVQAGESVTLGAYLHVTRLYAEVSQRIADLEMALSQQPEARQITPEWVIGYFPANVAQQYRNAVSDAFAEFAALHPKPEARGVVDGSELRRAVACIGVVGQYLGKDTILRESALDIIDRRLAALTGERNG